MKELKRFLMMFLVAAVLSVTALAGGPAFGQKGNDNRPPKEPTKVKENPDKRPPPSNNSGQGNSNRKKPE